jgi:hypothetical protein
MIDVSQGYLEKALAPGRNVRCRIVAGNETFTDADILSFEFNDVVHPDDMSFGTTCANRFQFEVWSRHNIPLTTIIRPFVGFAEAENQDSGNIEECSLGEFYITRRYRKRERYSVTCYDRMYRLDSRYTPSVSFPCTAGELLADIAWHHDFKVGFVPAEDEIEAVPQMATCREIIGYIAGLGGGFAKFDRSGVLRLRKLALCDFVLCRSQYTELSVKADMLEVRAVEFITEEETFSEGKGTKLTTYRQYNPFASGQAAKRVFNEWEGFSYWGLTAKMRGLPFLESGDSIMVQDDFENKHYFALISDYTLIYDGGLSARLVSKSKNPIDDYDRPMNQERVIEGLSESLRVRYVNFINREAIRLGAAPASLAGINFNIESRAFAVFNSQFTVKADNDCLMTLDYYINNVKVGQTPQTSLSADKPQSISLYYCFRILNPGRHTLSVTARLSAGSAYIEAEEFLASVSGQYMLGDNGPQRPEINVSETIGKFELNSVDFTVRKFSDLLRIPETDTPVRRAAAEKTGTFSINPAAFTVRNLREMLCIEARLKQAYKLTENSLALVFTNPVVPAGTSMVLSGFAVNFGLEKLMVYSGEVFTNQIILTTENLGGFNEIVIKYDSATGNLLSATTKNPLQSFNYILALTAG